MPVRITLALPAIAKFFKLWLATVQCLLTQEAQLTIVFEAKRKASRLKCSTRWVASVGQQGGSLVFLCDLYRRGLKHLPCVTPVH